MNKIVLALIVFALLGGGGYVVSKKTRGLRNNNPGNIKRSKDKWIGMSDAQSDPVFVQFRDAKYGIRAMTKIFKSYANRGVVVLSDIINTWAPPSENNVTSYIDSVVKSTGIGAGERVTEKYYPALIAAIIKHENGVNPYSYETITAGIALA